MSKVVYMVSLGPGDPDLVSLKALKTLQAVDAIYCPATYCGHVPNRSRAADIVRQLGIDEAKIKYFKLTMSKIRSHSCAEYERMADKIAEQYATTTVDIALCAQGDGCFYSSVYYLGTLLEARGIGVQRIAGIPAFIAAGTLANIHIVQQAERLQVIPSLLHLQDLQKACHKGQTVVLMKPSQSIDIIKTFIAHDTCATFHYFENIGVWGEEFYTTDKQVILDKIFPYFSMLIIQYV